MVKAQVFESMKLKARGLRPQVKPFSSSCSANTAVYLSEVGKWVLKKHLDPGSHMLDICQNQQPELSIK